jgi:hypothetical protein
VAAAVLLSITSLAACGGIADTATVVRVGDQAISKATVDHWANVIRRGGAFSGFRGKPDGTDKQRALALLISSDWLIGEAARQGTPVAEATVEQALAEREHEGGEFQKRLRATGQTVAGIKLEMRAELAAEAVREKLAEQADDVTQQEVLDFYRQNRRLFSTSEVRVTDLLENQPSPAAATAFVSRAGTGRRFAKVAYHEQVTSSPGFTRTPEKARLVNAIFSARPGVVSQPMPLNGHWTVFVVRRVLPERPESFAQAQIEATKRLRVIRQKGLKAKFDREFTALWRSRTKCESGYVGPGCPQSAAVLGVYEDPFSRRAHPMLAEQGVSG